MIMKNSILCAVIFQGHVPVKIYQILMSLPQVIQNKYNDILYLSTEREPCLT